LLADVVSLGRVILIEIDSCICDCLAEDFL
jgi:hypothetical protein